MVKFDEYLYDIGVQRASGNVEEMSAGISKASWT